MAPRKLLSVEADVVDAVKSAKSKAAAKQSFNLVPQRERERSDALDESKEALDASADAGTAYCTNCGAQLSGKFCGSCGHKAPEAAVSRP